MNFNYAFVLNFEPRSFWLQSQEGKQWHRANKKNYKEERPKIVLTDLYKYALDLMETNYIRELEKA